MAEVSPPPGATEVKNAAPTAAVVEGKGERARLYAKKMIGKAMAAFQKRGADGGPKAALEEIASSGDKEAPPAAETPPEAESGASKESEPEISSAVEPEANPPAEEARAAEMRAEVVANGGDETRQAAAEQKGRQEVFDAFLLNSPQEAIALRDEPEIDEAIERLNKKLVDSESQNAKDLAKTYEELRAYRKRVRENERGSRGRAATDLEIVTSFYERRAAGIMENEGLSAGTLGNHEFKILQQKEYEKAVRNAGGEAHKDKVDMTDVNKQALAKHLLMQDEAKGAKLVGELEKAYKEEKSEEKKTFIRESLLALVFGALVGTSMLALKAMGFASGGGRR